MDDGGGGETGLMITGDISADSRTNERELAEELFDPHFM